MPPSAAGCDAVSGAGDDEPSPAVIIAETADGARDRQPPKRPALDSERPAADEAEAAAEAAGGARARPARKRPARAKGASRRPAAGEAATPSEPPTALHVAPSAPGGECQCRGNCGVPRCRTRSLSQLPCGRPVPGDAQYCCFCECEVRGCRRPRNKMTPRWCQLIGLGF